jgi:putative aminopeptidase FrvX
MTSRHVGDDHSALALFRTLLSVPSPSGFEHGIARLVRSHLQKLGYASTTDGAGNVSVRIAGRRPDAPLACLAAHMDEIGFVVTQVEADGTLRVNRLGGLYPWKHGEGPVEIIGDQATVTGMLSMGSTHTAPTNQAVEWERVRIITGLSPVQISAAGVRPGSAGTAARSVCGPVIFGNPGDPLVAAWTFDDRMGIVALLRLLEWIAHESIQPHQPLLVAFTTGEEVGGLGAKVLAQRERPEVFIAVDGCPTPPEAPLLLDGRPGIWTHDRYGPYDQQLVRDLCDLARQAKTELQPAVYSSTASDASMVMNTGGAARAACFGHVRENSHGYEVARLSVFDRVFDILVRFVGEWQA